MRGILYQTNVSKVSKYLETSEHFKHPISAAPSPEFLSKKAGCADPLCQGTSYLSVRPILHLAKLALESDKQREILTVLYFAVQLFS